MYKDSGLDKTEFFIFQFKLTYIKPDIARTWLCFGY
jgi:hypothetical protein